MGESMPGEFTDILVAVLFGAFAIATIVIIFGVAGNVFHYILEAFRRSKLQGVFLLSLCALVLAGLVFAEQFAKPYVVALYRQITG
jgi:hypothetical protein